MTPYIVATCFFAALLVVVFTAGTLVLCCLYDHNYHSQLTTAHTNANHSPSFREEEELHECPEHNKQEISENMLKKHNTYIFGIAKEE